MDKKKRAMVILLSFKSGKNEEWCEKFLRGEKGYKGKKPPEAASVISREKRDNELIRYLEIYANKILSLKE